VRWLLFVIAGSLGFYGFKAGIFTIMTGGGHMVLGAAGRTSVSTNNAIALVLNMCLPIFWYLRKQETKPWLRHLLLATFILSIIAVPFTYSRGGVLGLCFVLTILFLRSERRVLALPAAALALILIATLAPDKWTARMQTLETYEEDRSAMGRIIAWKVGIAIANDSPFVGGGFEVFNKPLAFQKYAPTYHHFIDAHSIYFNLLGEHGYVGLGLYLILVGCTMASLLRIYRIGKQHPALAWSADYAHMLACSLLAYLFTGAFLSMAYLDLAWHLFALVVIVKALTLRELAALAPSVTRPQAQTWAFTSFPSPPKRLPATSAQ
jgi:probable O-glycosylation ligase (exosortase A-associated)